MRKEIDKVLERNNERQVINKESVMYDIKSSQFYRGSLCHLLASSAELPTPSSIEY